MPTFLQILAGIGALLVIAMIAEAWIKRNAPKRSLVERFKPDYDPEEDETDKPALGMEATDLDSLRISERANRSAESFGSRDFNFWSPHNKRKRRKPRTPKNKENTND